jgi:hypothetical protein
MIIYFNFHFLRKKHFLRKSVAKTDQAYALTNYSRGFATLLPKVCFAKSVFIYQKNNMYIM